MAIGIAKIFNISLPTNFLSPYKAVNIIEFWRRWHITLSRFLRDYLYFPLGGNRKGTFRRYLNIMIIMLLGGLWHGAGWTFVIWGALHGLYLVINHIWQAIRLKLGYQFRNTGKLGSGISFAITFVSVVIAWIFFRAQSLTGAFRIMKGMVGLNGLALPQNFKNTLAVFNRFINFKGNYLGSINSADVFLWIALSFIIVVLLPNTTQLFKEAEFLSVPKFTERKMSLNIEWHRSLVWVLFTAILGII
jgi:D-alanyl-lipoteichoic acid acyltransferase DltB (MBOAT superfamily)